MLEAYETAAKRHAKRADAAGTTHIIRLWLTMQPAKKKYSASSTCKLAAYMSVRNLFHITRSLCKTMQDSAMLQEAGSYAYSTKTGQS